MSYRQIDTVEKITLVNGSEAYPVASMRSHWGGEAHFIIDDHCYVLVLKHNDTFFAKTHIFAEAVEVLRTLPPLEVPIKTTPDLRLVTEEKT